MILDKFSGTFAVFRTFMEFSDIFLAFGSNSGTSDPKYLNRPKPEIYPKITSILRILKL